MNIPVIDIGVAVAPNQSPEWWTPVFSDIIAEVQEGKIQVGRILSIGGAIPDHNKNYTIGGEMEGKRRDSLTDANRQKVVKAFLNGEGESQKADALFFIDDDTVFPPGAISHLYNLNKDIVAGLYFHPRPPHNPIAYIRADDGRYAAITDYAKGGLFQVDSVGMGCTMIRRHVFEHIMADNEVFFRPTGTPVAVHRSQIYKGSYHGPSKETHLSGGWLHIPLTEIDDPDGRVFPFYALEYGRTEDHHFCELAIASGYRPWVDSSIECRHFKMKAADGDTYREYRYAHPDSRG